MVKVTKSSLSSRKEPISECSSQTLAKKRPRISTTPDPSPSRPPSTGQSIAKMVERFVQSISHINDSGSFDTSFEVKQIQSSQRTRHRCVTELDRENLMQFVREFEARQAVANSCTASPSGCLTASKSTPKSSPFFNRKLFASGKKHNNPTNFVDSCTSPDATSPPKGHGSTQVDADHHDSDAESAPTSQLQRTQPERSSLRSAVKMLQFFSAKKKPDSSKGGSSATIDSSRSSSTATSPVLMRAHLGCRPLNSDTTEDMGGDCNDVGDAEDEHDDGISSAGSNFTQTSNSGSTHCSRNESPDSSFEMHAPLVPSFKVTPPPSLTQKLYRNPAYEFARFIRGSFHAKRASVTKLRRSISDPDNFQHQLHPDRKTENVKSTQKTISKQVKPSKKVLADATKHSNVMRNRGFPLNASPFRRAWGQSSFRTPRADKHALQQHQQYDSSNAQQSLPVRRTASMNSSDNDVYIKSMDKYIDELKQTQNSRQQQSATNDNNSKSKSHVNFCIPDQPTTPAAAAAGTDNTALTESTDPKKPSVADEPVGVAAWGTSFERLLEDPAGLHTFAEFLKKEFSAENIYFWTACERFRHLDNEAERATQAMAIFSKHLANGSPEPVNVDSQARNLTQEKLQTADRDMFAQAQKQIFNLMKFDSYQRFIRSDLYKSCLKAEAKNQPLPYRAEDLDELLKTNVAPPTSASKLKKSASNAEDRRRKSLLPWHRKARCKSRDRAEAELGGNKLSTMSAHQGSSKLPQLSSSNSLKIPSTQNSLSDIHSSRSSLSSFDALPGAGSGSTGHQLDEIKPCLLCRVILSDGATTIVQTRPDETVGQLVERLLEKRGLNYPFYDVVINGSTKSIDLQSSAQQTIAGKEVLIEQRVAFKLDLPDPKVISVKSKPKKQLHEVIRPILQKYNYNMDTVQVLLRDTQERLDLSLPVTVADGQRLQIVLKKALPPPPTANSDYQNGLQSTRSVTKLSLPKSVSFPNTKLATTATSAKLFAQAANPNQSTLDEITNKVFNELLQSKVEAHSVLPQNQQLSKIPGGDMCSLKSDDCASETSSIFERMRKRDSNIPGINLKVKKIPSTGSSNSNEPATTTDASPQQAPNSEEPSSDAGQMQNTAASNCVKKPIIAKLKAGVKLQVTERVAENQDALLEGLKRAQLARLEDQRGTEINFELPDFLKNKENLSSAAHKLRKVRANLSPVSKCTTAASPAGDDVSSATAATERPQPAPRLSIANKTSKTSISPMKIDEEEDDDTLKDHQNSKNLAISNSSSLESDYVSARGPPPLPPKPKVLPIKPSNWGATNTTSSTGASSSHNKLHSLTSSVGNACVTNNSSAMQLPSKIPIDIARKHLVAETSRCAYLEEPSSSFV